MDLDALKGSILAALATAGVGGSDLSKSGHVRDLEVEDGGHVRFSFHLRPEDPGTLVKAVRERIEALAGVADVKIDLQLPKLGGAALYLQEQNYSLEALAKRDAKPDPWATAPAPQSEPEPEPEHEPDERSVPLNTRFVEALFRKAA